jgi:hypothetical protein
LGLAGDLAGDLEHFSARLSTTGHFNAESRDKPKGLQTFNAPKGFQCAEGLATTSRRTASIAGHAAASCTTSADSGAPLFFEEAQTCVSCLESELPFTVLRSCLQS